MTKRILFITATRIGDAVLSSGLLAHLVERHPDASFTIACGAPAAPLFARAPRLDRLIVVRKRPYKAHWLDLWSACAFRKWYLVVDLRASVFAWCVVARHRRVMRGRMEKAHRVEELGRVLGMDAPRGLLESWDNRAFLTTLSERIAAFTGQFTIGERLLPGLRQGHQA